MHANDQRCPSSWRAVSVTLGIALAILWPLNTASATEVGALLGTYSTAATVTVAPPGPQLSISVDNGRTSAAIGDRPTYTITVRNLGTTRVTGLRVTQSVPTGLKLRSADSAGTLKSGMVSWRLNLKATSKATLHTTMTVSPTPKELLRLATVACASVSAKAPPIVCATHSDQLPAGAAAQAAGKTRAAGATGPGSATGTTTARTRWYVAGGLGGMVMLIGALALMARRREPGRPDDAGNQQ